MSRNEFRGREPLVGPELPSIDDVLNSMLPIYRQALQDFCDSQMREGMRMRCRIHVSLEIDFEEEEEEAPAPGEFEAEFGVPEPAPQAGAAAEEAAMAGAAEAAEFAADDAPMADGAEAAMDEEEEAANEMREEEAANDEEAANEVREEEAANGDEEGEVEVRELQLRARIIRIPVPVVGDGRVGGRVTPPRELRDLPADMPAPFRAAARISVEQPYRDYVDGDGHRHFECRLPGCGGRQFDTLRGWKIHVSLSRDHHRNGYCHQCRCYLTVPDEATPEQVRAALRRHKQDWCAMAPKTTMKARRARKIELALLGRSEELEAIYIPGEPEPAVPAVTPPVPRRKRHVEDPRECARNLKRLKNEDPGAYARLRDELEL